MHKSHIFLLQQLIDAANRLLESEPSNEFWTEIMETANQELETHVGPLVDPDARIGLPTPTIVEVWVLKQFTHVPVGQPDRYQHVETWVAFDPTELPHDPIGDRLTRPYHTITAVTPTLKESLSRQWVHSTSEYALLAHASFRASNPES